MAVFKDANQRDWKVDLDGPVIRTIRSACGIDPISGEAYERMHDDPLLLADVLAVVCLDQIQHLGITSDQFKASIKGEAIDRATAAMLEAQLDFSPSRQKELLRATAARIQKVREEAMAKMLTDLDSPEFQAQLSEAVDKRMQAAKKQALTLLSSGMSLPDSLESPEA